MAIVGCYVMDLCCDNACEDRDNCTDVDGQLTDRLGHKVLDMLQIVGPNRADCRRQARELGWKFKRGNGVMCPDCAKNKTR